MRNIIINKTYKDRHMITVVIRKAFFLILILLVVGCESTKSQKEQTNQSEVSDEVNQV